MSDSSTAADPNAVFFTLEQLATLMTWATPRPYELRISIETGYEAFEEVAAFYRRADSLEARWSVTPSLDGAVELTDRHWTVGTMATVEVALAHIEAIEKGR